MVIMAVTMTNGVYEARPWAPGGNAPAVEWPPAPWRLFQALVYHAKRLGLMEDAWPMLMSFRHPPDYDIPTVSIGYKTIGKGPRSGFVSLSESDRTIFVTYPFAEPSPSQHSLLKTLLSEIVYLGRNTSPVTVELVESLPAGKVLHHCATEAGDGPADDIVLPTPGPATDIAALHARRPASGIPATSVLVHYFRPAQSVLGRLGNERPGHDLCCFRYTLLNSDLPLEDGYAFAEQARRAVMSLFGKQNDGTVAATFSGKDPITGTPSTNHQHAHFLPIDENQDGLIDHLAVFVPAGVSPQEAEALKSLEIIVFAKDQLSLTIFVALENDSAPARVLLGPSTHWKSHLPFVPPRHTKHRGGVVIDGAEDQIRLELSRRGFPVPKRVTILPPNDIVHSFRNIHGRHLTIGPRYMAELEFEAPLTGPLVIGAACHFGMGLFLPAQTDVNKTTSAGLVPLVPARMLNEFTYCPRLMYLEWVDGEWAESPDTVEGRYVHRRVDQAGGQMPTAELADGPIHARSVDLADPKHGLVAKMDLVEGDADTVMPVDYKRGEPPNNPERSWEPERVQLCVQGLILREHGYRCDKGVLYYASTRQRVEVEFDDALIQRTLALLEQARQIAAAPKPPPPLVDSPKCPRCSLVGICLPDETNMLSEPTERSWSIRPSLRLLYPSRPDALPFYVSEQGAWVGKSGERLTVRRNKETLAEVKLIDVSQLTVFGSVQVSTPLLQELSKRDISVSYLSHGGYFYGTYAGLPGKSALRRVQQFAIAGSEARSLPIAREMIRGKILNQRTLLRRNVDDLPEKARLQLRTLAHRALQAKSAQTLLGIEGSAAALYYSLLPNALAPSAKPDFDFQGRNRRPPTDPVNAVLSLGYAMLTKDTTVTLQSIGLDPYVGVFHHTGHGRPALALDLMEEFRPLIVDSVVLNLFNRRMLSPSDFVSRAGAVSLTPSGRKTVIEAYETRLATEAEHPLFGYRISYRRALEVQARILCRTLIGELPRYAAYLTR